jgi:threonyl-tRNA synthetase
VGDKELENNQLMVNIRESNEKTLMNSKELINRVHHDTINMPFRKLPLSLKLSERVNF